jgi:hypothetical protein
LPPAFRLDGDLDAQCIGLAVESGYHSANDELFLLGFVPMSVRVFLRRKVLTPAFRTDRALDESAHVRRLEIQAELPPGDASSAKFFCASMSINGTM